MSPLVPSWMVPRRWLNSCQLVGDAPSARGEPSTWYAALAAPQVKPCGNAIFSMAG